MPPLQRLLGALLALAAITAVGAAGYVWIEGWSWSDALYMTVITITTVGYREVAPLSGAGRWFTLGLIVTAVGAVIYLVSRIAELLFEGQVRVLLQRGAMQRKVDELRGHVIVCGFGRLGRVVTEELRRNATDVVVVEVDPEREADLLRDGVPHVIGSAGEDAVLERAGIARARAIVAATPSEADNVYIALAAREASSELRIYARAETETGVRRLRRAGATQVASPHQMGGMRLAAAVLRPAVVDFLEISNPGQGEEVDLEEVHVALDARLCARRVGEVERDLPRLRIVALGRRSEPIRIVPDAETVVEGGDQLVVIGAREDLERLAQEASGGSA